MCLVPATAAHAVVGGHDAPAGKYPYVAYVEVAQSFLCTGTLVAPKWIVTAGHCSSLTSEYGTPIGQPGQLIEVSLGTNKAQTDLIPGQGPGVHPKVAAVHVNPNYNFLLNGSGYDVSLLELATPVSLSSVKVAGRGEESLWKAGTMATIAGFGTTSEGGSLPARLQEAQVPITTDAYAAGAYPSSFESKTQIVAGYPQGGVDTCQGDSGGPLLVPAAGGALRLAGDTSYGDGCARPGKPGIYGRVGDATLREWIRSIAPEAVAPNAAAPAAAKKGKPGKKKREESLRGFL
jgi:secreted trypsin-like serine protease